MKGLQLSCQVSKPMITVAKKQNSIDVRDGKKTLGEPKLSKGGSSLLLR